jgi:hypothetical protein
LKAERAFGQSWSRLWQKFQTTHIPEAEAEYGNFIAGYWDRPYAYWNETGVYPGFTESGDRGRYGYMDQDNGLWLSEYDRDGISRLRGEDRRTGHAMRLKHVWDPGPEPWL